MGWLDIALLALVAAWLGFVLLRGRKKHGCCGGCNGCCESCTAQCRKSQK